MPGPRAGDAAHATPNAHVRVPQDIPGGFEVDATGEEAGCDRVSDQMEHGILGLVP